jgi:drug/metabolite transporter (DMT)-like permease
LASRAARLISSAFSRKRRVLAAAESSSISKNPSFGDSPNALPQHQEIGGAGCRLRLPSFRRSSSFVSTRAALNDVSPLAFITLRLALCALVLLALTAATRRRFAPLSGKWQHCAIAGALINGIMLASSHWGIVRTGAAPLALVQTLNPILTALLGGPLLGEWLRLRQWFGLALGAAGVGLIVGMAAVSNTTQWVRLREPAITTRRSRSSAANWPIWIVSVG